MSPSASCQSTVAREKTEHLTRLSHSVGSRPNVACEVSCLCLISGYPGSSTLITSWQWVIVIINNPICPGLSHRYNSPEWAAPLRSDPMEEKTWTVQSAASCSKVEFIPWEPNPIKECLFYYKKTCMDVNCIKYLENNKTVLNTRPAMLLEEIDNVWLFY